MGSLDFNVVDTICIKVAFIIMKLDDKKFSKQFNRRRQHLRLWLNNKTE